MKRLLIAILVLTTLYTGCEACRAALWRDVRSANSGFERCIVLTAFDGTIIAIWHARASINVDSKDGSWDWVDLNTDRAYSVQPGMGSLITWETSNPICTLDELQ
jgi:hypothetical protein